MDYSPTLKFLGAAGTVTGSKYLLSYAGKNVLIDCGLFQGLKDHRQKNWASFPVEPSQIDAVILTHAHLDHSGYLPRLVRDGFQGPIYATPATIDLCKILLPDSAYLMEEDAKYLNKRKLSKHDPALPLYTVDDAERCFEHFQGVDFQQPTTFLPGWEFEFRGTAHILGAAMARIKVGNQTITFSGDVGRLEDPLLPNPEPVAPTDLLVLESTYGNKLHPREDVLENFAAIIERTHARGGVLMIPAFAVGRAQMLMLLLAKLQEQGRLPSMPIYLNSPMAVSATALLSKYKHLHRLSDEECRRTCNVVRYVRSSDESKALNERKGPMIIISASGMITGGRILHHLKAFAPDPKSTIVIAGFQAAGTRGRALLEGDRELKIHGELVPVRAEVVELENLSAHGDYAELTEWLANSRDLKPRRVFLTHGEPEASVAFKTHLEKTFGWVCEVPEEGTEVVLRDAAN